MANVSALVAAMFAVAGVVAQWPALETLDGPTSPADQPAWLANLSSWRDTTLSSFSGGYNSSVYDNYLPWTSSLFIVPQSHIYDRFLYDREADRYTVDRFLEDLNIRYGGIDGVLLWHSYPNMGVDERSQFSILTDLPAGQYGVGGGLPALAALVAEFHARGIRVGLPYNPWDSGTKPYSNTTDDVTIANIAAIVDNDFVNGDTMETMGRQFFDSSLVVGHPLALQPEGGGGVDPNLQWTKMGWGYWSAPFVPQVDVYKWLEPRHITQICNRWATNHTTDLQQAIFNGIGFVSWENVWGIWNGLSDRDAEATRRVGALLRWMAPYFFMQPGWEPHTVLYADAGNAGVFASRWPAGTGIYSLNSTAWTIVNRNSLNYTGPVITVPCTDADDSQAATTQYWDLYHGVQLTPSQVPSSGGCGVTLNIEAGGFGAVLSLDASDVNDGLLQFAASMANMTARSLASYSDNTTYMYQTMTNWGNTAPVQSTPQGMVHVAGNSSWQFVVAGTEIEGWENPGVDVQYPWETFASRHHWHIMPVPSFYMDVEPVTNAEFAAFLNDSGYVPADSHNFLYDWGCSSGGGDDQDLLAACTFPTGWDNKPVTWVDLVDANAYCSYYGKRMPNDWEWQYAAQGSAVGNNYPWGNTFEAACVPPQATNQTRPAPPDVGSTSCTSPFGVQDLMGLVWQWTNEFVDDHTRAGLVRGGAWYRATGSDWYFPGDLNASADHPVLANTHNKLLLMAPSYDRHGTVGFRCVMDAPT